MGREREVGEAADGDNTDGGSQGNTRMLKNEG